MLFISLLLFIFVGNRPHITPDSRLPGKIHESRYSPSHGETPEIKAALQYQEVPSAEIPKYSVNSGQYLASGTFNAGQNPRFTMTRQNFAGMGYYNANPRFSTTNGDAFGYNFFGRGISYFHLFKMHVYLASNSRHPYLSKAARTNQWSAAEVQRGTGDFRVYAPEEASMSSLLVGTQTEPGPDIASSPELSSQYVREAVSRRLPAGEMRYNVSFVLICFINCMLCRNDRFILSGATLPGLYPFATLSIRSRAPHCA